MDTRLREYLNGEKIEYFAVLDYTDCREVNPALNLRGGFTPRSVILYLVPYYAGETVNLSRYAASLDYHIILRKIGEGIVSILREVYPNAGAKCYGDHSPIAECHAAATAGLGIIGDNGLLINEKYGSYVFVGDVVTDVPPEALSAIKPHPVSGCMHCGACKRACPTGILGGCGEVCLSALTQRKGELSAGERLLIKENNTAWGCDICQRVCPYNNAPKKTEVSDFLSDTVSHLTSSILCGMDEPEFERRAYAWRGRKTIMRNLEILENVNKDLQKQ